MELDFHLDAESLVLSTEDVIIPLWSIIAKSTISAALSPYSTSCAFAIRRSLQRPFSAFLPIRHRMHLLRFSLRSVLHSLRSLPLLCLVIVLVGKNLLVDIDCLRRFSNHHLFSFVNQKTSLTVLDDAAHIVGNEKDRFPASFRSLNFR